MSNDFKPHLFVNNVHTSQSFTSTLNGGGGSEDLPKRNRTVHGNHLLSSLTEIWKTHKLEIIERSEKGLPINKGEYITFTSAKKTNLNIESLDSDGAILLNVTSNTETFQQIATIFIPDNKQKKLIKKIENYINFDQNGKPKNQAFVDKIDEIKKANVENLWSSPIEFLPKEQSIWCELWISNANDEIENLLQELKQICDFFNIELLNNKLIFPERIVVIIKANYIQLSELINSYDLIAEIRNTEELNDFWLNSNTFESEEWINSALQNTKFNETNNYITILDSGVNNGHLLLKNSLKDEDRLTVNGNWGINDIGWNGHGTKMAGIALYGNLNKFLENNNIIEINHRLESVKILPPNGEENQFNNCPYVTENAINTAIINNPNNKRIFCMAVTGKNQSDFGKPSTWSAIIDKIIFGEDNKDKKLFVISAGNVVENDDYLNYPESNLDLSIESPAQSWNAITVGAYTEKISPDYKTVADKFELSPFSRTSSSWENIWPFKPEIIFEGGNIKKLDNGSLDFDNNLEILTTSNNSSTNNFSTICATSAATAFASNFLAKLRHSYPNAWEETIRALIIHSASWTPELLKQFNIKLNKQGILKMLRIVGYGIPNLEKAIQCKSNYLTFISEQIIKPYKLEKGIIKTNEIHYYEFPWPKESLENLGNNETTLRITLSYFIEPNPGEKGYSTKYSYQSTALKFSLITPGEDFENFKIRTNKINQDNLKNELGVDKLESNEYNKSTGNDRWALGADNVFKGSVHSNYWKGSAVEIASCNKLAIYPIASGWWKQLKKQAKADSQLRYSLIVSIETPENTTDIYTEIANEILISNLIKII